MLTYKFKNGSVVNGTIEEILKVAEVLGETVEGLEKVPTGYYMSGSKGLVPIREMNEMHIKNAITKIAYTFYQKLGKEDISIEDYLRKFVKLPEEPKLGELFAELKRRVGVEKLAK